jgi:hypothetical protein
MPPGNGNAWPILAIVIVQSFLCIAYPFLSHADRFLVAAQSGRTARRILSLSFVTAAETGGHPAEIVLLTFT